MIPIQPLGPRPLLGRFVTLEPLAPHHHADLIRIADAEPEIFQNMPFDMASGFAPRLAQIAAENAAGAWLTFAVRRTSDGTLIGSTSYLAIAPTHAKVEIGATWYATGAQGTAVNPACKFLLLENAFAAGYNRVEFKTCSRNARSRAALKKLGAREEGTLRGHMWVPPGAFREQGYFRDSVYFSVLADEWPGVRDNLKQRLAGWA